MKKYIKQFSLLVALIFAITFFIGCGGNNNKNKGEQGGGGQPDTSGIALSANMFDGFRANISDDIVALGIAAPTTPANSQAASLGVKTVNTDQSDPGTNTLVGIDDDGNERGIEFTNDEDEVITQKKLRPQINKLYVSDTFVYFTLTIVSRPTEVDDDYDQTNFTSNTESQTFLIDLENMNVYSLSMFPVITHIHGEIIMVPRATSPGSFINYYVYRLSIFEDEIHYTLLNPSDDLIVRDVFVDKNKVVFIEYLTFMYDYLVHPTLENVVFWAPKGTHEHRLQPGSDGNMYMITYIGAYSDNELWWSNYAYQVFSEGEWVTPDTASTVSIKRPNTLSGFIIINNGFIFETNLGFVRLSQYRIDELGRLTTSGTTGQWTYRTTAAKYFFPLDNYSYVVRIGYDDSVRVMDMQDVFGIDSERPSSTTDELLLGSAIDCADTDCSFCTSAFIYDHSNENGIIFSRVEWDGTVLYRIYVDDQGILIHSLYYTREFETHIIVIQPLNRR